MDTLMRDTAVDFRSLVHNSMAMLEDRPLNMPRLLGALMASREDKEARSAAFRLMRLHVPRRRSRQWVELLVDGFWVAA